ncbi:MAG: hypothetical protein AMXMBFR84_00380 [Candidatus Hydrogenedentota bacterium]
MSTEGITIRTLTGRAMQPYLPDLARLRIAVFRDFPYLYDGTVEYEEKYLQTYLETSESIIVLALEGEKVIGASTGLPLDCEIDDFIKPVAANGYDPSRVFYCGESVLLKPYRGRGLYKFFFQGREDHARALGRFEYTAFCGVQRPIDHPLSPPDYEPLDPIWEKFGYVKQPHLIARYVWKDVDKDSETAKPMVFWMKKIVR